MDTIEPTIVLLYVLVPCLLFVAVAAYLSMTLPITTSISEEEYEQLIRKIDADIEAARNRPIDGRDSAA